ncbi:MAG TPA: hypothetical protein VJV78_06125 [Polyangiales bacterium]|nr:hypothetical protein [Polyangiales bacterium]
MQRTRASSDDHPGWLDRSDARNHAVARSERTSPSFAEVALNGRPALLFDGKGQHLAVEDASALQFGTGDFTLAAVLRHTTPTASEWGYGCIASKQESTHPYLGPSLWGNSEGRTGQLLGQLAYHSQRVLSGADDLNQGGPLLAVLQRRSVRGGTKLILRVNGNEARSTLGPTVDVSAPGSPLHIGSTPDPRQALRGNIAEIVAIKGPLAEADSESLEAYLREKYGL